MDIKNIIETNTKTPYDVRNEIPIYVDIDNLPTHLQGQIEYFEKESQEKEEYRLRAWQSRYVERFLECFGKDVKDKLILDNASGSGYMAIELAKMGANVVATDLTLKYLSDLKHHTKELGLENRISLLCCTSENLPFKNDTFDYSLSNAILEHLPDEKSAIKELERVTKTNGGLMVTVPVKYRMLNPILLPVNYIHDKRIGHLRRYNEAEISEKFSKCKVIKSYYTGHTKKVISTLLNIIFKTGISEEKIENDDIKLEKKQYGSSNIITFLRRI